jgi:hypothetical protein
MLMIFFGQYIQGQYWYKNAAKPSPGGPPTVVHMALDQNPITLL